MSVYNNYIINNLSCYFIYLFFSEESLSPTGEYGGPLKKRRFARESVSDQTENSLPSRSFINSNLVSHNLNLWEWDLLHGDIHLKQVLFT